MGYSKIINLFHFFLLAMKTQINCFHNLLIRVLNIYKNAERCVCVCLFIFSD